MATKKKPVAKKAEKPKLPSQRLDDIGIQAICEYVASGESLRSWCDENGFAIATLLYWIDREPSRIEQYARAREKRADVIFEALDEVSEQARTASTAVEVAGLRLKSDNIKWKLARMSAKKYGEKLDLTAEVTTRSLTDEQLMERAAQLKAKLGL
jgi:hypothetical protein